MIPADVVKTMYPNCRHRQADHQQTYFSRKTPDCKSYQNGEKPKTLHQDWSFQCQWSMANIPRYLQVCNLQEGVCNLQEGTDTYMFRGLPRSVVGKSLTSKQDFVHTVFAKYLNPKSHIHHQTQQILSKREKNLTRR